MNSTTAVIYKLNC